MSDQGKLHTYACGFLLLCSHVLLLQSGSCLLLPLHVPFPWLGAPSLGSLVKSLLEPDSLALSILPITQESGQVTALLLLIWDYSFIFLILRASSLAVAQSHSTPLEEVSKSWGTVTCWRAPAALSLVAGGDTTHASQGI